MVGISETLCEARSQVNNLRDAIAVVSAHSTAADPQTLVQSAEKLEFLASQAENYFTRVRRLIHHLGASTMSEAAVVLCRSGRKEDAQQMLALSQETEDVATSRTEVALFLQECLDGLAGFTSSTARQSEGGRFIGSA